MPGPSDDTSAPKDQSVKAIRRVAVVGLGLIGGSLALAMKRKTPGCTILGVDEAEVLDEAQSLRALDKAFPKNRLPDAVSDVDAVFLAVPIDEILRILPVVAETVGDGTVVTDVGSTKKKIVETASSLFSGNRHFIGGHPMAGAEGRGIAWADPLLFENAVYVLTPSPETPVAVGQRLGDLIERIGAKVLFLTPSMHDQVAAAVSHLPQMVAVALVNMVARHQSDSPMFLKLAAGGFRDMTRIASSPYFIWKDIVETNRDEILKFLDEFIQALKSMRTSIESLELAEAFENAARNRLSIPKDTKGFLKPHYDLLVRVEDKPGVIASISTELANASINIKDIEILKVREGEAGTLRLSLETPNIREKAAQRLNAIGFPSKPM